MYFLTWGLEERRGGEAEGRRESKEGEEGEEEKEEDEEEKKKIRGKV